MKTIYLCGKITGDANYVAKFNAAAEKLTGNKIINPVNERPAFGITRWFFYMITAIKNVWIADKCYFLSDWTNSRGAKIEHFCAWIFGKEIYYIQDKPKWPGKVVESGERWYLMTRALKSRHNQINRVVPKYVKR